MLCPGERWSRDEALANALGCGVSVVFQRVVGLVARLGSRRAWNGGPSPSLPHVLRLWGGAVGLLSGVLVNLVRDFSPMETRPWCGLRYLGRSSRNALKQKMRLDLLLWMPTMFRLSRTTSLHGVPPVTRTSLVGEGTRQCAS